MAGVYERIGSGYRAVRRPDPASPRSSGTRSGTPAACSTSAQAPAPTSRLAADLADGTWARRYADLAGREEPDVGYRVVVAG